MRLKIQLLKIEYDSNKPEEYLFLSLRLGSLLKSMNAAIPPDSLVQLNEIFLF